MLILVIPESEYYDESKNRFFKIEETTLKLEHCLRSISKWEETWRIPFMGKLSKTPIQLMDYVRCMTINGEFPRFIYESLTTEQIQKISEYMETPQTAVYTDTSKSNTRSRNETVTNETIYYLMAANQIPFECQDWHLSKLLALLKVCAARNGKPKKRTKSEMADLTRRYADLNAQRKAQMNTSG